MGESVTRDYRERKRELRNEERVINLIYRLRRALELTMKDAQKDGFTYGEQSTCVKALKEFEKWEQERQGKK